LSLERAGFCVDTARNGREAWTKAQRKAFDLVVTDEKMPVMSGRELCRQLRKDDRYTQTPIIFLTANPADLDAQELDQVLSVSAVFEKPFRPEAILHQIENELLSARSN
jgi:two-component system chemotaxis response regulator CheY